MKRMNWRLIPLACFALLVCFLWRGLFLKPKELPSSIIGQHLPAFQLPSLLNHSSLFSSTSIQGKIALLNVWASWCATCEEEQLFLLKLAKQGINIYGLNYKDKPKQAIQWLDTWGNPYVAIGEDSKGKVAIDLGVYGAPETFLIDQNGVVRYRHAGALTQYVWQQEFLPKIKDLVKIAGEYPSRDRQGAEFSLTNVRNSMTTKDKVRVLK